MPEPEGIVLADGPLEFDANSEPMMDDEAFSYQRHRSNAFVENMID